MNRTTKVTTEAEPEDHAWEAGGPAQTGSRSWSPHTVTDGADDTQAAGEGGVATFVCDGAQNGFKLVALLPK